MTIEERLAGMELQLGRVRRYNRRLLGALLILSGVVIVLAVITTKASGTYLHKGETAEIFVAKRIVVVDEIGRGRILLSTNGDQTRLALSPGQNGFGAELTAHPKYSEIAFKDVQSEFWFVSGDTKSSEWAFMSVGEPGGPRLALVKDNKNVWSAPE